MLLQVNAHELTRNEQGLFTYLYHWLVVTEQSTLRYIEDIVGNITHFSAISWEGQQNNVVRWCFIVFYLWCKKTTHRIILFFRIEMWTCNHIVFIMNNCRFFSLRRVEQNRRKKCFNNYSL